MPWVSGLRYGGAPALLVSVSLVVSAQTPRPHPAPAAQTDRLDRTPQPLTPTENVWALALNNELSMPPAYDGTQAFLSIEGDRLVAYDLNSGSRRWMVAARPEMAPVAGGGLVFIREANRFKALREGDGSVAWELPLADKLAVHPVWDNGWLVLALATGEVRALRATDGQVIWSRDLASPAHAAPALAADRVYIPTTDHRIVALDVASGDQHWERRLGGAANEILALDERIYAGSLDNFFYCVMAADGRVDWRWRTGGDVIGKPVADEHSVYFVALDNVLRAMNLVSGGQQWMRPLPFRPAWGPVKAGTTIIVAGQTPPLRAFNMKDGVAAGTLTGIAPQPEAPASDAAAGGDEQAPLEKSPRPFLALAADALVAAAPYVLEDPLTHAPRLLILFKEIARGASATLVTHSVEPALVPAVAALPNLVQIAPVTPTTPPPRR
ncbi:MAG: PQQ-binding-like beta-propeller repeat protein [Vicinamibacterales bacterium]